MKLTAIGLATALMLSGAAAFAQGPGGCAVGAGGSAGGGSGPTGSSSTSSSPGTSSSGTTGTGNGGISNQAGSAAAGANSMQNPSGNQLLNNNTPGTSGAPTAPSYSGVRN